MFPGVFMENRVVLAVRLGSACGRSIGFAVRRSAASASEERRWQKNDNDLFDRLRQAGLRTQVAKTLSKISEGASKKSLQAARSAVGESRSLAGEIERRLPSATAQSATSKPAGATAGRTKRPVRGRKSAVAPTHTTAAAAGTSGARAPRGQNKAKILELLKAGPKTAAEIAQETGIGTGTVRSTLSKLAIAGEVAKGDRGYQLPQELELRTAATDRRRPRASSR